MTQTLTEFLLARIAEDEHAARDVAIAESSRWHHSRDGVYGMGFVSRRIAMLDTGNRVPAVAGEHIARWDPARVLAECEAKRRIVEEVLPTHPDYDPLYVQRLLALPYADHPGYDRDVAAMSPSKGTTRRTIRITDELWEAAQAVAEERGESVSDVIRSALEEYVRQA